jgi:hypothetical protein
MVDKSITLCKDTSGWFFAISQSGQATSARSETHPTSSADPFTHHSTPRHCTRTWLSWLSSKNRRQGAREHLACRPSSMGSPRCHRRRPLSVALRQSFAPSFSRLHERNPQRYVRTHKMIVGAPPLQMGEQVWSLLSRRPGATSQRGYSVSDRQIHPLNTGSVQPSREA